jgi:Dihydrodipicolinate synthase/N-acetylneuraminate lyase
MRIETEQLSGVLAIMPTPATADASDPNAFNTVDHDEARRAASSLIADGVDAIMLNGTFGEGATLTWDELRGFARTVVDEVGRRVPVFGGATTLNTRDTILRARALSELGVDGLLLGRPMWSPCDDETIVDFYRHVAAASPELGVVVYDNPVSFRGKIPTAVYEQLAKIPQVIAAKYPALGDSFAADLDAMGDGMRLLPLAREWYAAWQHAPGRVPACWSGSASCGPAPDLALRDALRGGRMDEAGQIADALGVASETFFPGGSFELFSRYNVPLEKIRIDEAGYIKAGPCRPPYIHCPDQYAEGARESGRRLATLHREFTERRAPASTIVAAQS